MQTLILVGIGGFLGAISRHLLTTVIAEKVNNLFGWQLPYGTLAVNVLGSFCLAVLLVMASRELFTADMRLLLGTGFFGAFTTFSSYANEAFFLFRDEGSASGIVYIIVMNGLCMIAVVAGVFVAQRAFPLSAN